MTFSKTTEYIIRILTYMVINEKELFSARYLHEELGITYKYLTNLLHRLSENEYLLSVQGKYGGYKFLKKPEEISLFEIIVLFEGEDVFTSCLLGLNECSDENPCVMHKEWSKIKIKAIEVFKSTTIADLKKNSNLRLKDIDLSKKIETK